jgi:hypothetical protein
MKKTMMVTIIALASGGFYGCNGGEDKKAEEPKTETTAPSSSKKLVNLSKDCSGIGNLAIEEEEAKKLIAHFEATYIKKGTAQELKFLTGSEWIDANVILSIAYFLEKPANKNFDGVRFISSARSANENSSVVLVPTKAATTYHEDIFGDYIPMALPTEPEFKNFSRAFSAFEGMINNFERIYRGTTGIPSENLNPLSSSVWVDECVFYALKEIIENPDNDVDGIRVHFAAYKNKDYDVPGQFDDNQSTIILVPTTGDGGTHNDRWDIIPSPEKTTYIKDAGYNHGELCPRNCPPDGGAIKKAK